MTVEEAIRIVRGKPVGYPVSCEEQISASECVADYAEKYLKQKEAWEKVKEEIEDKIRSLDDELKNGEVCLSYYYGKLDGLSEVLEIIDKHLKEVEK